jgi:mannose-1-phosphate guanylyltransferase
VTPAKRFLADLDLALAVAEAERCLVTFGIRPTHPETGYGYVRASDPYSPSWPSTRVRRVASFHEKPASSRARAFLRRGDYYWNSGMFAWRADVILDEIGQHVPTLSKPMDRLSSRRSRGRIQASELARAYPRLPSISIDHAVMEKSCRVAMIPASFRWNDIGSWDAVADVWPSDESGNATRDPMIAIDAHDNVVATRGKPVALLGVRGLAIVDSGDAILVCPRDRAQDVRAIVAALEARKMGKLR